MNGPARRRDYVLVTACYWAFTLSDGALRMLVLLHLHDLGQTPLALALVLLPYEVAGLFTNVLGGWLGARYGLKRTLVLGLLLQIAACAMLTAEAARLTIGYVMATQVLSGIAKDLTKTGAKSYVRQLAPGTSAGGLFRLVAWLTGSKNAMKGLGFFAGGALLATAGFRGTNAAIALLLLVLAAVAQLRLDNTHAGRRLPVRAVLRHDADVNWLAAARLFLFGSRDVWFAVALPLFLAGSLGWSPALVGAFLALWVIGYGGVQATTPNLLRPRSTHAGAAATARGTALLTVPLLGTAAALHFGAPAAPALIAGLLAYGALFATVSSLHSWLIVALGGSSQISERIGFYYAANAAGRLAGTLASGWLFAAWEQGAPGLVVCLLAATAAVALATACTLPIRADG
ncbi:MAG TPA: organoarsenical effux MFS transporter ArsJ [Planctomycetota bacterium]|nr:organoarsenical effux MFS transporter ArsJ [Planctomycetota bacterium]